MAYSLLTKYGNPSENNTVEHEADGSSLFRSYGTRIARKRADGIVELFPAWNYSQTTRFYRGQFLGEGIADTRRKIESGVYVMV